MPLLGRGYPVSLQKPHYRRQAATGAIPGDAALAVTSTVATGAAVDRRADSTLAATATITAGAAQVGTSGATSAVTATITAGAAVDRRADSALAVTATLATTAAVDRRADSSLAVTATIAAGDSFIGTSGATSAVTATLVSTAAVDRRADSSLAITATLATTGFAAKQIAFTEDFEGAADGVALTTSTTGFSAGSLGGADGTTTHSTNFAITGTRSMRIHNPIGATNLWRTPDAGQTKIYRRVYWRAETRSSTTVLFDTKTGGSSQANVQVIAGTGELRLREGGTEVAISTTATNLSQWYRLEHMADYAAGSQKLRIFYGTNLHGAVPDEEITGTLTVGSFDRITIGTNALGTIDFYWDAYADGSLDWIGSAFPSVTGAATLAETATLAAAGFLTGAGSGTSAITATLATAGFNTAPGTATSAVTATITAGAAVIRNADAALAVTATLLASPTPTVLGAAALAETATLASDAVTEVVVLTDTTVVTATITAGANVDWVDGGALNVSAVLAADGANFFNAADADFQATAELAAAAALERGVTGTVATTATITASAGVVKSASAAIVVTATTSATPQAQLADSALVITTTTTSTGNRTAGAQTAITATASIIAGGVLTRGASASLTVTASGTSAISLIREAQSALVVQSVLSATGFVGATSPLIKHGNADIVSSRAGATLVEHRYRAEEI